MSQAQRDAFVHGYEMAVMHRLIHQVFDPRILSEKEYPDEAPAMDQRLIEAENILRGLVARYDTAVIEEARKWLLNETPAPAGPQETPWPPRDVVGRLIEGADHLLHGHDCDCHGWETLGQALKAAQEWYEGTAPGKAAREPVVMAGGQPMELHVARSSTVHRDQTEGMARNGFAPKASPEAARRWRCKGCGLMLDEDEVEVFHVRVRAGNEPDPFQCGPVVEDSGSAGGEA